MTSILKRLANYGVESAEVTTQPDLQDLPIDPPVETDLSDDDDELWEISDGIDDDIEEIVCIANDLSDKSDEITNAQVASNSIEQIVDQTIETYGKDGITEEGAELMRLSLESVLKISGLGIPVSLAVPSFESKMSRAAYSTEAEEKKAGIISRIFSWISDAFSALVDAISTFWKRLFNSSASIGKYGDAVLERAKKAKGTAEGNLNLGTSVASYCSDKSGVIKLPATILASNVQLFGKFCSAWHGTFEEISSIVPPSSFGSIDSFLTKAEAAISATLNHDISHLKDIKFLENRSLKFTPGAHKWKFIGSKVELVALDIKTKGEAPILTQSESVSGVTVALKALDVMKRIEDDIKEWTKNGKAVITSCKSILNNVKSAEMLGAQIPAEVKEFMSTILGGCKAMADGWSKSVPEYLKMVKANIRYCELSVGKLSGNAKEEMTGEKPEKYNKHTNEGGHTYDNAEVHAAQA